MKKTILLIVVAGLVALSATWVAVHPPTGDAGYPKDPGYHKHAHVGAFTPKWARDAEQGTQSALHSDDRTDRPGDELADARAGVKKKLIAAAVSVEMWKTPNNAQFVKVYSYNIDPRDQTFTAQVSAYGFKYEFHITGNVLSDGTFEVKNAHAIE